MKFETYNTHGCLSGGHGSMPLGKFSGINTIFMLYKISSEYCDKSDCH